MTRIRAEWLTAPGAQAVCAMLTDAGHQAWFVGGCVRNALIGAPVADLDISTDARPDRVVDLAEKAGFKAVPTGIDHGTVTVVVNGHPFEITTFRRDVETDGRRAVVAFADTMEEDARRRDFTMNALYAGPDGVVVDPVGEGLADLIARRLRFIGSAEDRIHEDYLRILRFFRFHAWYADPDGGIDAEGLAACAEGIDGLASLSRERVGAEMKKLLLAPDPAPAVAAMAHAGVLAAILPGASADMLTWLTGIEGQAEPDAIRRLAALGGDDVAERLRLSKAEAARLDLYRAEQASAASPEELGYRHGAAAAMDILRLRGVLEGGAPSKADLAAACAAGGKTFPLQAADLMPTFQGRALGEKLKELEARWIASGFRLTREDLLKDTQ